eukprot:scpid99292/ scgid35213/ 
MRSRSNNRLTPITKQCKHSKAMFFAQGPDVRLCNSGILKGIIGMVYRAWSNANGNDSGILQRNQTKAHTIVLRHYASTQLPERSEVAMPMEQGGTHLPGYSRASTTSTSTT